MMQPSTILQTADWLQRANFLSQAVSSGMFQGMEKSGIQRHLKTCHRPVKNLNGRGRPFLWRGRRILTE